MSSKKWFIIFSILFLLIFGGYATFNILVDPFGVFNDVIFDWYSYDMTNNPRVAKIGYLDKNDNYKNYDSYVIGCSSTSSFSPDDLNKYFGGNWYNMIMYGADMQDVEQTTKYVVDNYGAKNILINIFITNSTKYDVEEDNITKNMHQKLNKENPIDFYSRYMFLPPDYSIAKIEAQKTDAYLTKTFDVFNVKNGAYDKKVRDVEPIHSLYYYYEQYPAFANYPHSVNNMDKILQTCESIKRIKEFCEEKNVNLKFVMAPVYDEYLKDFDKEKVKEYYEKVAEVTPYWDFTTSYLTSEPRFFYDETHFRNALGTLAIKQMAGKENKLQNVGEYVTKENVKNHLNNIYAQLENANINESKIKYEKEIPIITYHSIVDNPKENSEISREKFENQIKFLSENGYEGVFLQDLIDYVNVANYELPSKCVCITFDDGYLNNYEIAFPILQKYNMKANIFMIGNSIGKDKYKNTNYDMNPHFSYEQALEMANSGLISFGSHTYEMHDWAEFEDKNKSGDVRENILIHENETEEDYIKVLRNDCEKFNEKYVKTFGKKVNTLSYPSGKWDTLTNVILKEEGIELTCGIEEDVNVIVKGLPQSLYALNRFNMDENSNIEIIIK